MKYCKVYNKKWNYMYKNLKWLHLFSESGSLFHISSPIQCMEMHGNLFDFYTSTVTL